MRDLAMKLVCFWFGHKWRKRKGEPLLWCEWCGKTSDILTEFR